MRTLQEAIEFGQTAAMYQRLRKEHPTMPAKLVHGYTRDGGFSASFEEYACSVTTGHRWTYTGAQYGGDDESYGGEGRCYCCRCGADGDA